MTRSILSLLLVLYGVTFQAQVCDSPSSQIDLHGNNIRARLLNGGDLFWDMSEAQFVPNPTPGGNDPATIFAAGLWMGGVDPAGNLKLAAVTYRTGADSDYWPGPLDPQTGTVDDNTCANWDRHFKVTAAEIIAFLEALPGLANDPAAAVAQFPGVMGWPGQGNAHFSAVWNFDLPATSQALAPFADQNDNGIYDPLDGDYPAVSLRGQAAFVPAEIVWCVFNDHGSGAPHGITKGKALQMEIQLTAWAFDCAAQPVLNNTVFTSHKLIYRGLDIVDSCFVGLWVDFDLGCYEDDYMGSNPALSTFYAYNQDALDGNAAGCVGTPTFGDHPPVQSVTFLNQSMDKFIGTNNAASGNPPPGTTDPQFPEEFYRYLTGHWRDGSPITYGGTGFQSGGAPTDFYFPSDPADPNGWSMCTASMPLADRRGLASFQLNNQDPNEPLNQVQPGAVNELTTAWTVHFTGDAPCNLGNTFDEIATLHTLYDGGFSNTACSGLGTNNLLPGQAVRLSPNPANDHLTLRHTDLEVLAIDCYDAGGRLAFALSQPLPGENTLDTSAWPNGLYVVRVMTRSGTWSGKFSVLR